MKIMNSQKFANIAQSTVYAVGIETALKAVGRPTFIYMDKNTDKETKKYSATKEFIYQALCFLIYLSVIPFFKKAGYSAAKAVFKDNKAVQDVFERCKQPLKVNNKEIKNYSRFINEYDNLKKDFKDIPEPMQKIKGGIEGISIVGSILGLTILAPQISHVIIHPIMRALGIEKKKH